jgi:hypothetical protein
MLARLAPNGKGRVTRKLLDRVNRELGEERCSKSMKPRRRKRLHFTRSCFAALVTALMLQVCLVTSHAATGIPTRQSATGVSGYSAAALFNQGNAFARAGKTGLAILNYERARLLAPGDDDLAANLHFVRAKAGLTDARESWFNRSLLCVRPNILAWLGSFGLVLVGMSMLLVRVLPPRRLAFRWLTFVGALLISSAIGSAIATWPRVKQAVVITPNAPARTSPVSFAESAFKLPEGETVTVRAEHHDFALVQTTAGRSGWVPRADLGFVVPQFSNRSKSRNQT